jgi:hypothetical protein
MAEIIVAQRMWQRRDSAANWTSVNPILANGEFGVEESATPLTVPAKFKIGTGTTAWNDLPYGGGTGSGGGSAWLTGIGVPDDGDGVNGDMYLRTSNGDVYQKASGTWGSPVGNIRGPAGADGANGADGDPGPPGPASSCFPGATFKNTDPSAPVEVGAECYIPIPFGFEVAGYTLVCNPPGAIKIDVRRSTFAGWPAGPGDSICGGVPPELLGGDRADVDSIPAWSTTIASSNILTFVVLENDVVNSAVLLLKGERT